VLRRLIVRKDDAVTVPSPLFKDQEEEKRGSADRPNRRAAEAETESDAEENADSNTEA